jgi:hypothetical protein
MITIMVSIKRMPKMTKVTKMPKIKVFYPFKMIEFRIVHAPRADPT